ncbi:MAG: BBP7 family outer membrane beta-barrel protein [Planctomycetota bacterium]
MRPSFSCVANLLFGSMFFCAAMVPTTVLAQDAEAPRLQRLRLVKPASKTRSGGTTSTASDWKPQREVRRGQSRNLGSVEQVAARSDRVVAGPVGEQPGTITSIETRDAEGNLVTEPLGENEYYFGQAPPEYRVGQSMTGVPRISAPGTGMPLDGPGVVMEGEHHSGLGASVLSGEGCESCGGVCQGVCDSGPQPHFDPRVHALAHVLSHPLRDMWFSAEYLRLRLDGQISPALVTSGPDTAAREDAGVQGEPGVFVLFGSDELVDGERSAGRFEVGRYLPHGLAISASYLVADDEVQTFTASSSDFAVLARPFIDIAPGNPGQNAELVSFPGEFSGNVVSSVETEFGSGDVLLRGLLISEQDRWLQTFIGYSFLTLDDNLRIRDFKTVTGGGTGLAIDTTLDETDRFLTENNFHAVALGLDARTCFAGWSLNTRLKVGFGVNNARVNATGSSLIRVPDGGGGFTESSSNSGLLVQESNRGTRRVEDFAVHPELRVFASRRVHRGWDLSVGYHLLYISRVLRAAEQIDPILNLTQLAPAGLDGIARPETLTHWTDMTAHGILVGLSREF